MSAIFLAIAFTTILVISHAILETQGIEAVRGDCKEGIRQ